MRMRKPASVAALAVVAALTFAGCTNREEPAQDQGDSNGNATAPVQGAGSSSASASSEPSAQPFGKACSRMTQPDTAELPAGEAIAKNPMLHQFASAARESGLDAQLNKQGEQYTIFAPSDGALSGQSQLSAEKLRGLVLTERQNRDGLEEGKRFSTLGGNGQLSVSGSGEDLTVSGSSGQRANVICGNIPASNATIFIVDKPV